MSKSLKTIQVFAKIGKILSKIVFICCIVGAAFCLVALVAVAMGVTGAMEFGGINIHGLIEENAGISVNSMYALMVVGVVACVCEGIVAKFAEVYFEHELAAGTPFTFDGAREMLRLGIIAAAVSLGGNVVISIIREIMSYAMTGVQELSVEIGTSVGIGVAFIIVSFICKYGAEQAEKYTDIVFH